MTRRQLGLVTFGLLGALFVLVLAVPVGGVAGVALFALVVVLVGIWYVRFSPWGVLWDAAEEWDVNPWWLLAVVLFLGAAWAAFRFGLGSAD